MKEIQDRIETVQHVVQKHRQVLQDITQTILDIVKHPQYSHQTKFMRIVSVCQHVRWRNIGNPDMKDRDLNKDVAHCVRDRDLFWKALQDISHTVNGSSSCHEKIAHVKTCCQRALREGDREEKDENATSP